MDFSQLTATAAGGSNNISSITSAFLNSLANNTTLNHALQQAVQQLPQQQQQQQNQQHQDSPRTQSSRQNLQQAHNHSNSTRSSTGNSGNASNHQSNSALPSISSLSNLNAFQAAAAAGLSLPNLPSQLAATLAAAVANSTNASAAQQQTSSANSHHQQQTSTPQQQQKQNQHHQILTAHNQSSPSSQLFAYQQHLQQHIEQRQKQQLQNQLHRHSSSSSTSSNRHSTTSTAANAAAVAAAANLNISNPAALAAAAATAANLQLVNDSQKNSNITKINKPSTNNANTLANQTAVNNKSIKSYTYYKVGECVYFELAPGSPLQIGKIDELTAVSGDNNSIEVKAVRYFRRRDISNTLMHIADRYHYDEAQEEEIRNMSEKDKNLLKQRELFYSRQIETFPASSIRGKCTVQLLNESESLTSYLDKEDYFFYTLVYDPQQKTIIADRGEIRVGQKYQAEVSPAAIYTLQLGGDPADPRDLTKLETLVYTPDHNLSDDLINKYLTIAKSVGTFARALDCSSSIKQPSLHLTAASASRDITLLYAMEVLHQNNYDLAKAVCALVPSTGPVLCRDEIEEWTAGEATLFEEAIEKYGREFVGIRQDFIPWKSVKNIVEYYYMWKTTDRSINHRRMKAAEAESKVKQVLAPNNKKFMSIYFFADKKHKLIRKRVAAKRLGRRPFAPPSWL